MKRPIITIDDLSMKLSRAAAALLDHDSNLRHSLTPAAWQAAAKEAGLPRLNLPNDPVAIAIHTYAMAIISERLGKRPTETLVRKEVMAFTAAYNRLNGVHEGVLHA